MAFYSHGKEQTAIEETKTTECPVSLITPDIRWLNGQFHSNCFASLAGGSLYGTNAGKWPAWWADTITTCTAAKREADSLIGITT
jgi:hypothetical protein